MANKHTITVSAPGKIHFLGEHVVVHGKPALLAAIDKRCRVTLTPRSDKKIEIISKDVNESVTLTVLEVAKKQSLAAKNWRTFLKNGDTKLLNEIAKGVLDYAVIAVGESLLRYAKLPSGFTLTIVSDIPIGFGLGSSAAIAVTVAAAISLFAKGKVDKQEIYDIAFATEQKKHGRPSGGDPAVVLFGGLVWFRKESDHLKTIQSVPVMLPAKVAKKFFLLDTGKPKESTGEMVFMVKQFRENDHRARNIFDDQEQLSRDLLAAIKHENEKALMDIIKRGERNLEIMGVVSIFVKQLIRKIEKSGGAAKISGGGGKTKGTGMLLVYHSDSKKLNNIVQSSKLQTYKVYLGGEGLMIE